MIIRLLEGGSDERKEDEGEGIDGEGMREKIYILKVSLINDYMKYKLLFIGILMISLAIANCQERKFNSFSITAWSDQKITRFDMNFIVDMSRDGSITTTIRYDLTFFSDSPIKNIYLNFYPHFTYNEVKKLNGPYIEIKGIDFNKYLEKVNENTGDYKLNVEKLFKDPIYKDFVSKETKFIEFFIFFTSETKDIMEMGSINPNTITFAYNNVKGSIPPQNIYIQLLLPSGYRIDLPLLGNWNEQYVQTQKTENNRFSYWRDISYVGINPEQRQYGFYFIFFQLQKNLQNEIDRLTKENEGLIKMNYENMTKLDDLTKRFDKEKEDSKKWRNISIFFAIYALLFTLTMTVYRNTDQRLSLKKWESIKQRLNRKTQITNVMIIALISFLFALFISFLLLYILNR